MLVRAVQSRLCPDKPVQLATLQICNRTDGQLSAVLGKLQKTGIARRFADIGTSCI